ncbi:hypothetical protein DEVEQU_01682 [Devosia equisanguinis]|uniref:Uncharacterized protein n=1 Tax=Devosia equisanguinis TaxID=2490941 RepID=A0A3S4GJP5_9HYPH|nr:hypothetical protein [Devosia equisanguinis]VDS04544.1 hypothetical protein DEVEQU_01682 [Devosia equisanguinis]
MPHISVKEAIRRAKDFVHETFDEEDIVNVGLEEVKFDDQVGNWEITIGFSRPWDNETSIVPSLSRQHRRAFKIVTIDGTTGEPKAIMQREIAA